MKETYASYYGVDAEKEHLNEFTASGEKFGATKLTCSLSKSFAKELGIYRKWGTVIKITYGDIVSCARYNDTGPAERLNRGVDLTPVVFKLFAPLSVGIIKVQVEAL